MTDRSTSLTTLPTDAEWAAMRRSRRNLFIAMVIAGAFLGGFIMHDQLLMSIGGVMQ